MHYHSVYYPLKSNKNIPICTTGILAISQIADISNCTRKLNNTINYSNTLGERSTSNLERRKYAETRKVLFKDNRFVFSVRSGPEDMIHTLYV